MRITGIQNAGALVASLASTVSAVVTYTPGPSYSVGIPSGSSISSSSTGSLYFQLSASTSYQWVGLGIGSEMSGSTIFVMYTDGTGNVTISARDGTGHVQPTADSSIQSGVTLLEGSGVVNGKMIANVKCTSCKLDSSSSSSSSPWIAAWNSGSAINSQSLSYSITQHSGSNYKQFEFDLSQASISSDSNPFVTSSSTSGGSSTTGTGTGTGTATGSAATSTSSSDSSSNDNSSGDNSGSSGATVVGTSFTVISDYDKAHGIVMGVVVVLLFPLGAIFMRMGSSAWMHGAWQMFSLVALLCGFGLGVKLAQMRSYVGGSSFGKRYGPFGGGDSPFGGSSSGGSSSSANGSGSGRRNELFNNTHTIFGVVIVALFLIQPLFGIIHHIQYKRNFARAGVSHLHIWYGRILMILAVVNGGLGLKLANNSKNGEIAYGVIAGIIGLIYILVTVFKRKGSGSSLLMRKEGSVERGMASEDVSGGEGYEREPQRHRSRRSEGRR
ncbi:related to WSC4 Cell wall integrity and stress response component 4 [Phialocephala subalpina]|uniref:Related to WSC4 Cell wall integrity and stress response component 4 n=1 Tax=Phialocephala subalpina TaxID=576137 RepID=A0A1L7XRG3_9HELO|nr:related to WSC4 Cell wall integrity and stress response component 4 [Phialocephala subalpina]